MKNKILLIVILVCIYNILFAQQPTVLKGNIVDTYPGDTAIGASVTVYKKDTIKNSGLTDIDGNYSINIQEAGIYDVEVTYLGYKKQRITNTTIIPNIVNILDFKLEIGEIPEGIRTYCRKLIVNDNITSSGVVMKDKFDKLPLPASIATKKFEVKTDYWYIDSSNLLYCPYHNCNDNPMPRDGIRNTDKPKIVKQQPKTFQEKMQFFFILKNVDTEKTTIFINEN